MTRFLLPMVLCAALFLVPGIVGAPGIAVAQDLDPAQFALVLADLPPGFVVRTDSDRYLSNADAANGDEQTQAELDEFGRQVGYAAVFVRASAEAEDEVGVLEVESQTSIYETAEGARGLFELRTEDTPKGWCALTTPALGDQTAGISRAVENAGGSYELRAILLRKGRIVASITTLSLPGTGANETVELAQTVAERLP